MPGRNGTRSAIAFAPARRTAIRSSTVCEIGSPVEPPIEIPCEPCSICQSIREETAAKSMLPSSWKGVTSGVMAPRMADVSPANLPVTGHSPQR